MIKCPNCNTTDHEEGARFCHICGNKLLGNNEAITLSPERLRSAFPPDIMNKLDNEIAIDLGLPSGTRWASCNVGASKPQECGKYFAWGEIETKEEYSWNTYSLCKNGDKRSCHNIGFAAIMWGSKYDVAHMNWGGRWRMPTHEQFMELINECTFQWTEINFIWGGKFISRTNDNSIFLPATGIAKDNEISSCGQGFYWSCEFDLEHNSNAFALCCSDYRVNCVNSFRKNGLAVRPVIL